MTLKRIPKRPMIWTGDLPCRYFQARPVDLSIEFQMEAVKMLDDLETLWKKFEAAFWKRFIPLMNKEIEAVTAKAEEWDKLYETWKPDQQKAAGAKLNDMAKAMGEKIKKESTKFATDAFAETMKGVDNTVAKAKVFAVVKVSWTIVGVVAKVATVVGAFTLPIELLKAKKELTTAHEEFKKCWGNLQSKAEAVQHSALSVGQAYQFYKVVESNEKQAKPAMEKLRAAGKKLKGDVDAMDVYIASARQSLQKQDAQIEEMTKALASGKVPQGDKAKSLIAQWNDAHHQCEAELKLAAQAKQWAAQAAAAVAGAQLKEEGALKDATRKVNTVAEKILKVDDTVEKGKKILEAVESISKLAGG